MIEISKEIGLDMGHRIPDHASKCRNLHGHRYTVTAYASSPELEQAGSQKGMVVDFGFLKKAMMVAIHDPFDHRLALYVNDPLAKELDFKHHGLVSVPVVPTAENLAAYWFDMLFGEVVAMKAEGIIPKSVELTRLVVQETPTSVAVYTP